MFRRKWSELVKAVPAGAVFGEHIALRAEGDPQEATWIETLEDLQELRAALDCAAYELGWEDEPKPVLTSTLVELSTPWAECYRGSGRLTGRLTEEPVYCQNGDVAPGWTWVGNQTEDEFYADFVKQEHDSCHTPDRADHACPHCQGAGWV